MLKKKVYVYFKCVSILSAGMCVYRVYAWGDQKRPLESLKLELQTVVPSTQVL